MGSPGLYPEGVFHGRYDAPPREAPSDAGPIGRPQGDAPVIESELAQVSVDKVYTLLCDPSAAGPASG